MPKVSTINKRLTTTKDYVRKNKLFLRNKAKFRKVKLNVNKVLTRNYVQLDTWSHGKKQSQTKPKRTQNEPKSQKGQNEPNYLSNNELRTTNYELRSKKRTQFKSKQTQFRSNFSTPSIQIYPISHQRTMNDEQRTNIKQIQFPPFFKILKISFLNHVNPRNPRLLICQPRRPEVYIHFQWYIEFYRPCHLFLYPLCMFLRFLPRQLKYQLVMNL